jgi:hypothetical protein
MSGHEGPRPALGVAQYDLHVRQQEAGALRAVQGFGPLAWHAKHLWRRVCKGQEHADLLTVMPLLTAVLLHCGAADCCNDLGNSLVITKHNKLIACS